MKKNLLYSLVAAGTLLVGGLTAYAVSETAPKKVTRATSTDWVLSPENEGNTATLPNNPNKVCEIVSLTLNGFDEEVDVYTDKISVTYGGQPVNYNRFVRLDDDMLDAGQDNTGWAYTAIESGIEIAINYKVFTTPGELVIKLEEGAFEGFDSMDPCPALTYTHTYGGGDTPDAPVQVAVKSCKPAAEAVVKSLSKVTIRFDITKLGDNQVFCDATKADQITLSKAGAAEPIKATGVAFDEMAYEEDTMPYTIEFPETTEAGEYTVTVPAGFFWAAAEQGAKPADAVSNDEITVKYTVDPNAKSGMQVYTILDPVQSPETVESFEEVNIDFTEVSGQIQFADEPNITITKDGTPLAGVTCNLTWNWNLGNMHTAKVYFEKDEDTYVIKEDGNYELTIGAGSIFIENDQCEEIKAKFIVKSATKSYSWTATPQNEGKIDLPTDKDSYTQFTFKINGAEEVSYDEWEDPNHDPIYGTTAKSIQVTYNGESVKNVANVAAGGESNIGYSLRSNLDEPEIVIGISNQVFTKGGVLAITIDEGRCTADGNYPTPEIRYTCTVGEIQTTKDYEVKVSPSMDISEEYLIDYFKDGFKIEFINAQTVVPNMVKDYDDDDKPIMVLEKTPRLKVGDVIYFGSVNVDEVKDAECPTFIITYPEMFDIDATLGGYINFSIDEGTFTVDGEYDSPAISQTWRLKRTKEVDTSYIFGPGGDIVNKGEGLYPMISFNGDEYITLDRSKVVVKFNEEVLPTSEYTLNCLLYTSPSPRD